MAKKKAKLKNYIGISRDHSASMAGIAGEAMVDYHTLLAELKENSNKEGHDTLVSTVMCGHGYSPTVQRELVNCDINAVSLLARYPAQANGTPLWDSVGALIEMLEAASDAKKDHVSFVVMIITDGQENRSTRWSALALSRKIKALQATDRWTFVFRVPYGHASEIEHALGIPRGNIQEWEQTSKGMKLSMGQTQSAVRSFYANKSLGINATSSFYSNLSGVSGQQVRDDLKPLTTKIKTWPVPHKQNGVAIQSFVESKLKRPMKLGGAFYQLTKTEKAVQHYKKILIRNKKSGAIYGGDEARSLLQLPAHDVKLSPGDHGQFDIFIQSTSTNRKLVGGTDLLYSEAI